MTENAGMLHDRNPDRYIAHRRLTSKSAAPTSATAWTAEARCNPAAVTFPQPSLTYEQSPDTRLRTERVGSRTIEACSRNASKGRRNGFREF